MNVFHVISDENIGGAGILLERLLSHMDPQAVQNAVALPKNSLLRRRIADTGATVVPLQHDPSRINVGSVRELFSAMRAFRADLVHANASISARVAAKCAHLPVLFTRHCCFPPKGIYRLPPVRSAAGFCNSLLCDGAIATAEAAKENLLRLGIPANKITVIINGSDPVRTVPDEELATWRERLGITSADYPIGMCARLEKYKGQQTLLQAAALLEKEVPAIPFVYLLVGIGSQASHLWKLAADLGILHRVRFAGFVEDVSPIYRLMRIHVNCSTGTETSCLAISEGMSAALPTIASDYGGNKAMIGAGAAGILFPPADARALADAILHIYRHKEVEASMKQAALERFAECYTAKRMADETTALYHKLLSRTPSASPKR